LQLKKLGFKKLDALEPSETMLLEAKKDNIYNNYCQEFLTESPTTLSAGMYMINKKKILLYQRRINLSNSHTN
jgi:hypothetical protein